MKRAGAIILASAGMGGASGAGGMAMPNDSGTWIATRRQAEAWLGEARPAPTDASPKKPGG
jgi:hypothetical protein